MGAHVVGVPVATGGVVGDDDVGAHVVEHGAHGGRGIGEVGARPRPAGGRRPREPAIPESR